MSEEYNFSYYSLTEVLFGHIRKAAQERSVKFATVILLQRSHMGNYNLRMLC